MDFWFLIMEILLLLAVALIFGFFAQWLKQSAIIGYLVAGALVGPIMFSRPAVASVAELGVSLLLFSIGLEFSFGRLKKLGAVALGGGTLQVFLTLTIFAVIFSMSSPAHTAVALGAMVALSSTAVVLRILVDRTEIDSVRGRNALGILLFQDIAVVPLFLLVAVLSYGGGAGDILIQVAKTFAAAVGLIIVFYLLFYYFIPRVLMGRGLFANRELVVLLTIVIALGSTWSAHALGLSPALGSFLAGMMLAESPFATQIRSDIGSLRTLFVTLFFTSIGMLANPLWFIANWSSVLFWLVVVFAVKTVLIYVICLLFKVSHQHALATGLTLAQIGEFSFVLATSAKAGGLIAEQTFLLIVSITILSMFFAPYMVAYAGPLAEKILKTIAPRAHRKILQNDTQPEKKTCHIVVIGFGPAGQEVANAFDQQDVTVAVIELNPRTADMARQRGLAVYMGDATRPEVITHAGVQDALAVVITVPDPRTAEQIVANLRVVSPNCTTIVRSRYHIALQELQESGASIIVDEEKMIGQILAQEAVNFLRSGYRDALACALAGETPPQSEEI